MFVLQKNRLTKRRTSSHSQWFLSKSFGDRTKFAPSLYDKLTYKNGRQAVSLIAPNAARMQTEHLCGFIYSGDSITVFTLTCTLWSYRWSVACSVAKATPARAMVNTMRCLLSVVRCRRRLRIEITSCGPCSQRGPVSQSSAR